jgi:uncharacterized protein
MKCPRCESTVLDERERDGIMVDACASCRGIWLDRGELEKLIARATQEIAELSPRRDDRPPSGERYQDRPQSGDRYRDHDDDDRYRRHPRRKRGFLESLGEIFD